MRTAALGKRQWPRCDQLLWWAPPPGNPVTVISAVPNSKTGSLQTDHSVERLFFTVNLASSAISEFGLWKSSSSQIILKEPLKIPWPLSSKTFGNMFKESIWKNYENAWSSTCYVTLKLPGASSQRPPVLPKQAPPPPCCDWSLQPPALPDDVRIETDFKRTARSKSV